MRKFELYLVVWLCTTGQLAMSGQLSINLNLYDTDGDNNCFTIELVNESSKALDLAGQNYRLYYDSDQVFLDLSSIHSLLPESYSELTVVEHYEDIDASGFGTLLYDGNMGFLNLAVDYNLSHTDPLVIEAGKLTETVTLCFEGEVANENFTWGQNNVTNGYATAFVEIARISKESEKLDKVDVVDYRISAEKMEKEQDAFERNIDIFPNPFRDNLQLSLDSPCVSESRVVVSDLFGNIYKRSTMEKGSVNCSISGQNLDPGVYLIEIIDTYGSTKSIKAVRI